MRLFPRFVLVALATFPALGSDCGQGSPPPSTLGLACIDAAKCDDGVFCNGVERCEAAGGETRCAAGFSPCAQNDICDEGAALCLPDCAVPLDADGDGSRAVVCGGDDCDDDDATRFPGNAEVCDLDGHDEDCDPTTFGERDADQDGFVDSRCCNDGLDGEANCGTDCDDANASVHPVAVEACNGVDDNCDGAIDDGPSGPLRLELYPDLDLDGYGAGEAEPVCPGTPFYSPVDTDCDDDNPHIFPGAIRCFSSQFGDHQLCTDAGEWIEAFCPNQSSCVPQPAGHGVCAY